MITLKNVNKYFNKNKKNELHVIDNISLEINDTGLVTLLGPSGCGKTTLLNVIGGMDKIKSGSIYVNGKKISSKNIYKVDKIRNLNIAYIFQDYKLIDNISVYDNVAMVLRMIGIKDKKEIRKRTEFVLEKVGMIRYIKRPAGMLSGGERQRVGIARALVKDPSIILADEPTGNLDSKNTLEIMNIIKSISKDRLVILVTHEEQLAKFYSTRIIEIKDGKIINDYENKHNDELDYIIDNKFYLKDFKNINYLKNSDNNIAIYSNNDEKLNLDIVVKNNNIYIKTNKNEKIEIIDENSSIEFINDNYKKIYKSDIEKYDFDYKNIINNEYKKKYCSILTPFKLIKNGFKKVFDFSVLKKILLIGFFISAIFIMYSISNISACLNIEDKDFIKYNKNYLRVEMPSIDIDKYLSYEKLDSIDYIIPGDSIVKLKMILNDYYQARDIFMTLEGSLSDIELINTNDIYLGRLPENDYEVVVDKMIFDDLLSNTKGEDLKMIGIDQYNELLNRKIKANNMNEFHIVGVVDKKSPSIYMNKDLFIDVLSNDIKEDQYYDYINEDGLLDYDLVKDKVILKKGRLPENDYEVIVNIQNKDIMPLNKKISESVNNKKLTVVGYYDTLENYNFYLSNKNTIKYSLLETKSGLMINGFDKDTVLNELKNLNLNVYDSYEYSKKNYISEVRDKVKNIIILSFIIILISIVEIILMIRSSFLSRIKEIGIYRAIGVKKKDIYGMFFGEIFAITTISSLPGILLMGYVLYNASKISYFSKLFLVNPVNVLIAIIFVYILNLMVGLIPVFTVIRKRPAQILSRYDLE